ncbi:hypothetical protein ACHGLA_36085 [Streptomyces sp. YH02]|uniref:hypothetical protein n=1 Tax=Streptomyces sp. YH02 TaxID=3256999 RepID=UPI0037564324
MAKDEIAHIRTERAPAAVAALAARRGLGDLDGHMVAYDRGYAPFLRYRSSVGSSVNGAASGACSTLIDPTGNALNTGFGHRLSPNVKG